MNKKHPKTVTKNGGRQSIRLIVKNTQNLICKAKTQGKKIIPKQLARMVGINQSASQ